MEPQPLLLDAAAGTGGCIHHPAAPDAAACDACTARYCSDCLVPLQGQRVCAGCKRLVLRNLERRTVVQDRLAHDAFLYSVVGSVICQFICQPLALAMGIRALKRHRSEAGWPDRWKAVSAVVISSLWLLVMLALAVFSLAMELAMELERGH